MNLLEIPDEWKYLLGALIKGLCTIMGSRLTQNAQTQRERQKWQAEKLLDYYTYSINELMPNADYIYNSHNKLQPTFKVLYQR